jgi:hypothetical protein
MNVPILEGECFLDVVVVVDEVVVVVDVVNFGHKQVLSLLNECSDSRR